MPDRQQGEAPTAEEIALARIDALQVRDGGPTKEDVLRAILTNLQSRFGEGAKEARSIEATPEETAPAAPVETATEVADGDEVAPDAPDYVKKGLVAAVEAVTGDKFVKGRGNTYAEAVMYFKHSSRGANVRVVG